MELIESEDEGHFKAMVDVVKLGDDEPEDGD